MSKIDKSCEFISDGSGSFDVIDDKSGEILATVGIPSGRIACARYLDLIPEGASVQVSEGVKVWAKPCRLTRQTFGKGSHESGANPDYKPTSASRLEKEMRRGIENMRVATSTINKRLAALDLIEAPVRPVQPQEPPVEAPLLEPAPLAPTAE